MQTDDRQMVEDKFPTWISEKRGWENLVIRWKHKDGGLRYLESSAEPTLDRDGQIIGFRGVDRDITDRKLSETALKESESKYRNLVESSPDGIISLRKNGRILSVNESFCKLTGFEKSDFIDKFFLKIPTLLTQDLEFFSLVISNGSFTHLS
jgi:PAS domain-containing protein